MSKPGKSLKGLCKKLGVRLTVKRGKKRVYKSITVLKRQCANKKKKKVKKKVKRRRKFGTTTKWIAPGEDPYNIHNLRRDGPRVLKPEIGTKLYVRYKGKADIFTDRRIGPEQAIFGGLVRRFITDGHWISVNLEITEAPDHPELLGETLRFINPRDILSVFPKTKREDMRFFNKKWDEMKGKSSTPGKDSEDMFEHAKSFLHPLQLKYEDYFYAYDGGYFGKRKRKRKKK
tara:strand:- start:55 stop:747 length:693 start_codon:yes stop_codon:yes gene_type:complete